MERAAYKAFMEGFAGLHYINSTVEEAVGYALGVRARNYTNVDGIQGTGTLPTLKEFKVVLAKYIEEN